MATNEAPQRITAVCSCGQRFTVRADCIHPECPECGNPVVVRPPGPPPSVRSPSQRAPVKLQPVPVPVARGRGRRAALWLVPTTAVVGVVVAVSVYKWSSRSTTDGPADAEQTSATSEQDVLDQSLPRRDSVSAGSAADPATSPQKRTSVAKSAKQQPAPVGHAAAKPSRSAGGTPMPASAPPFKLSVTPDVELRRLMRIKLDHLKTRWTANTKGAIAEKKTSVAQITAQIAQEKRAMDHVRRKTKDIRKILGGVDRRLWFSQEKSKVSSLQQGLNARVREVDELEYVLAHNLYPISLLGIRRENGDFGTLTNGHVTRIVNATNFLARFGSRQFYCQNFKTFHPTVGTVINKPVLVVVSGTYRYVDRDGVKTGVVVRPVLDPEIASAYALGIAYRQKKESERAARRKNRISDNREAVKNKTGFPILDTVYEPKELILIVRGRVKPKPPKVRREYRIVTSRRDIFVPMQGIVTTTSRKRVETAASKKRRANAMRMYLTAKADFVGFALDAFIQDARTKIRGGQIHDESGRLRSLIDKMAKDAFGAVDGYDYRKNAIKGHLRSIIDGIKTIAIENGHLPSKPAAGY